MKNLKSTFYVIATVTLLLGLVTIGLGLRFRVWIEPQSSDISSLPENNLPNEPTLEPIEIPSPVLPSASPVSPTPDVSPSESSDPVEVAAREGKLRVSNPTDHPLRLALLERSPQGNSNGKPAHWDFAPMEGGTQGLLISLPQQPLKLKKGDILVAFAQDGSRLYWGPYVVGETSLPVWNKQKGEWQLVLQRSQ